MLNTEKSGVTFKVVTYGVWLLQMVILSLLALSFIEIKSPQLLKTISSIAKSLPYPPTPLFTIFRITEVCPGNVWKTKADWIHSPVSVLKPPKKSLVFPEANCVVSKLSQISKLTLQGFGKLPLTNKSRGVKFTNHDENS